MDSEHLSISGTQAENQIDSEIPTDAESYRTPSGDGGSGSRKRKLTSTMWNHFKRIKINGAWRAVCNYCQKDLSGVRTNGTNHLHSHFKKCPGQKNTNAGQVVGDGSVKVGTYNFDEDNARRELVNMVILHEYPLSMVEHIGFRRYSNALQPLFKVVSRNTIKRDILKIFVSEREKTMKLLEMNRSRIAITTDMWTSNNQKRGFMAITAHFIDDSWILQSRLLRFIYVPCPHTAETLAKVLMDCMLDWNIDRKLSTLTVDNCTTNDAMLEVLLFTLSSSSLLLDGKLFHMRCSAHILNLIVKDGLEVINESIENIRFSVSHWTATAKREEKFIEAAHQLQIDCTRKLVLDCKTRWNSTYMMLKTALIYKDVFPRLKQRGSLYKRVPSENDWVLARVIAEKLQLFYSVTELFSGTIYPTSNLFFPNICEIRMAIYEWMESDQDIVKEMATKMATKFDKYWNTIHGIMAIATVLDPRFKMKLIEFYFPLIYVDNASLEIERIRKLAYDLVKQYQSRTQSNNESSSVLASSSSSHHFGVVDNLHKFDLFVSHSVSVDNVRSDLDRYLDESLLPRTHDFDILSWWRTNGIKYPTLHAIARDILAIPVSTVASESAFSTSGRIVSPHRSRLHSNTIEALMCTRDWLWNEIKGSSSTTTFGDFTCDEDVELSEGPLQSCIDDENVENITLCD